MPHTHRDSEPVLRRLGLASDNPGVSSGCSWLLSDGVPIVVRSPIDGRTLATVRSAGDGDVSAAIDRAAAAFKGWRTVPAPHRGEFVRLLGVRLRERKADLAALVTWETGKIMQESLGEVQEMIDICDFAVGLSRQLHGLTIPSERPGHRMMEQWHPLGPIGVITAFNFPMAVWAWNAMLALVCGDCVVWKPSEKTPLTALACHNIAAEVMACMTDVPPDVLGVIVGHGPHAGQAIAASPSLPLVSATGSVRNGRSGGDDRRGAAGPITAGTWGQWRDDPDAVGRSGFGGTGHHLLPPPEPPGSVARRLRRLIVHQSIRRQVTDRLIAIFARLRVGNPLEADVLVGPLIDEQAGQMMEAALADAVEQGGIVHGGRAHHRRRSIRRRLRPPGDCRDAAAVAHLPRGNVRANPVCHRLRNAW